MFDMDGLLLDSEPSWSVAEGELAARLGGRVSLVHDEDGGTTLRMLLPVPGGAR